MKYDTEWLTNIARSGRVTRYHNTPMVTRQTIADHTWGVMVCLNWLLDDKVPAHMLKAAMYHDVPEIVTGDVPAPAKADNSMLKDVLTLIENQVKTDLDIHVHTSEWEAAVISMADTMELMMHCKKEMAMGNKHAHKVFNKGMDYLHEKRIVYLNNEWPDETTPTETIISVGTKVMQFMTTINMEELV